MKRQQQKPVASRRKKQLPPAAATSQLDPAQRLARIERRKARKRALSLTIVVL